MTYANDNDLEVWRPIASLPEYIASSHGRIMCVPRLGNGRKSHGGKPYPGVWSPTANRYILQFRRKTYKVARLVCEAFHGPAPAETPVCMHLDENSRNNRPENLAWGTQKANLNAPGFLARSSRSRMGRAHVRLSPAQRREIISRAASGEIKADLAKEYGIAPCTVSNMTRAA